MTKFPQRLQIPCSGPINGAVRIPGSKSLTNRAVLIAALADGASHLIGVLDSDDTKYMISAWEQLGVSFKRSDDVLEVIGCNGKPKAWAKPLFIGNAGTAARFLTAALTLGKGEYLLTGNERMQQRPISDLIKALNALGGQVEDQFGSGCPPVKISASGLKGGKVSIQGEKSSQYISALMMTAPYATSHTEIQIVGNLVSRSYVEMTRKIMADFGVIVDWIDENRLKIPLGQRYSAISYEIEGDASSASYFMGMAAITGGSVKICGIKKDSSQGDIGLLNILEKMGCEAIWESDGITVKGRELQAVDVDMNTMSDVAPTLAAVALFARGTTRIRNVGNMRIKECDRIRATVTELERLGAQTEEWEDGFSVSGMGDYHSAILETYDDHRMAMSLSLAGLKIPGIVIQNPECVTKTFPNYFDIFQSLVNNESVSP